MLKVGIFGLGLIGGSIAKALKDSSPDTILGGFDRSKENAGFVLENKIIDYLIEDITEEDIKFDLVIVAVPVSELSEILAKLNRIKKKFIITDVCSVKEPVIEIADQVLTDKFSDFVPGHPISGLELSGPQNSRTNLFKDSPVLLTPLSQTSKKAIEGVSKVWRRMGGIPFIIDPILHDKCLAATSHLPHVLAYLAIEATKTLESKDLNRFIGGSFRDLTRVAESSPALWTDIFFSNKTNLIEMIQIFRNNLDLFQTILENRDKTAMLSYLDGARKTKIKYKD
ncbi:MAG: prephenate dehydrogenase/arogenate dehydrogenase family protein [Pseudomonadota bacterium]|nr:prephenate dehydrogenase/arogenate dehydrogenase family protein [Pseudomonadota bacterium]